MLMQRVFTIPKIPKNLGTSFIKSRDSEFMNPEILSAYWIHINILDLFLSLKAYLSCSNTECAMKSYCRLRLIWLKICSFKNYWLILNSNWWYSNIVEFNFQIFIRHQVECWQQIIEKAILPFLKWLFS